MQNEVKLELEHDPFVDKAKTYRRTIWKDPGERTIAIGQVELRPLDAGDQAELGELRVQGNRQTIDAGIMRLLLVEKALVSWTFRAPVAPEAIRRLSPIYLEQIYAAVDVGGGESAESDPPLDGSDPTGAGDGSPAGPG